VIASSTLPLSTDGAAAGIVASAAQP
jgi:hypothetical protein